MSRVLLALPNRYIVFSWFLLWRHLLTALELRSELLAKL